MTAASTCLTRAAAALAAALLLAGCGTVATVGRLEDGAGAEAARVWERWVASGGDIAAAATWERKVQPGVTALQVEQSLASVAVEFNLRGVGELPLSRELATRSAAPQKLLKIYSFCNPGTARKMVDFSPHMAAFLPCRISLVERDDGLWLYTLNMDMMIRLGRKLPPELRDEALNVREAVFQMLERGSRGDF